ncbi:unnamed protein product, partial [marine sediment metagenome]
MKKIILIALAIWGMLFLTGKTYALTCYDLDGSYVYSQESPPVYLGFFGSAYALDSIMNQYGTYGSEYNSKSVRNEYGSYGSEYGMYSANNNYAFYPP